jgi:hypothetical protein
MSGRNDSDRFTAKRDAAIIGLLYETTVRAAGRARSVLALVGTCLSRAGDSYLTAERGGETSGASATSS